MTTVLKLAISLPIATAKSLEKARAKKRLTRSAAIAEAVDHWIAAQQVADADRRYIEGYLHAPELGDEVAAIAKGATSRWEPWK